MDTTAPSQGCRWGRSAEGAKRPTATSGASIPAGGDRKNKTMIDIAVKDKRYIKAHVRQSLRGRRDVKAVW